MSLPSIYELRMEIETKEFNSYLLHVKKKAQKEKRETLKVPLKMGLDSAEREQGNIREAFQETKLNSAEIEKRNGFSPETELSYWDMKMNIPAIKYDRGSSKHQLQTTHTMTSRRKSRKQPGEDCVSVSASQDLWWQRWKYYSLGYISWLAAPHSAAVWRQNLDRLTAVTNRIKDLTASTESKRTTNFSLGGKQFYVTGSVNGAVVEALPDTGADASFISPHLASQLGLHPVPGTRKKIILADKKNAKSPGMVKVPWKFANEQDTHMIACWILPGCIRDLVLGNQFLKATHSLTKFCDRIKSKLLGKPKQFSLSFLGAEKQRLRGHLNGQLAAALPDTGSDAMFINGAYARKIGLNIDSSVDNQVQVRLANGSTITTSGIVRDADWKVGKTTVRCNFYVLENLCVDIILSNDYLFEMKIFLEQEEYFFDSHSEEDHSKDYLLYFCILRLVKKKRVTSLKAVMLSKEELEQQEKQEEFYRRDKRRDEIMALPEDQQEAASQAEIARQRRWEALRPEREAKWIAESHPVAVSVQNGVSWQYWWKKRILIGISNIRTKPRSTGVPHITRVNIGGK